MAVSTYSPKDIKLVIAGYLIGGFDEDDFVEIEHLADGVTSKSGADGEIARSIGTDLRCSLTLRLLQTSLSNQVLTGVYALDQGTPGGLMVPVLLQDLNGTTNFSAAQAWITKLPNVSFGREVGSREWVLNTGEPIIYNVGGSIR